MSGFGEHVGTKNTFQSLNARHAKMLATQDGAWKWREDSEEATFLLFEPLKLGQVYQQIRMSFPDLQVYMFSPRFYIKLQLLYNDFQVGVSVTLAKEHDAMNCFRDRLYWEL